MPSDSGPSVDFDYGALTFTEYDLEVHLEPAKEHLSAVARISIRNDGKQPLQRIALDLSSSLQWEAISELEAGKVPSKLHFDQRRRDTDTDHTGAETEALVTLGRPLAPGATARLTALYSGSIARSSARMERSGAPATAADQADWDAIGLDQTLVRGFGNVLWYPVASPPIFLGDGAKLAEEIGAQRRRDREATTRLRLQIEYTGKAPATAFFCGRMANFQVSGEPGQDTEAGIATAEFGAAPLGFGSPSLFVVQSAPDLAGLVLGLVSSDLQGSKNVERVAAAAQPLIREWLGTLRERVPVLVDHGGQPFAQGAFLVESGGEAANPFAMVHLLSHAWFASDEVWLDEGVAQFLPLVAVERADGRGAALAILEDQRAALILAESNAQSSSPEIESLTRASREVLYRNKAVAVLWMLRGVVGDEAMKKAFSALRSQPVSERGSREFESALEQASGKDLAWFFKDWVLDEKGLPDLSIVSAAARAIPERQGVSGGALVAVEVRNEGAAAAEVPITVRSGDLTATERLRIPGHGVASTRILFQGRPQEVEVNDGSVPEATMERHIRSLEP